jgi:hypothetical protein
MSLVSVFMCQEIYQQPLQIMIHHYILRMCNDVLTFSSSHTEL